MQTPTPKEMKNLVDSKPDIIKEMRAIAKTILERDRALKDKLEYESYTPIEEDEELLEQLKSLGYAN